MVHHWRQCKNTNLNDCSVQPGTFILFRNQNGLLPIHVAADRGSSSAFKYLLDAGSPLG